MEPLLRTVSYFVFISKEENEMSLFNRGKFVLHSGGESDWKIDCDALTDGDLETLAWLISNRVIFGKVIGIPTGGLRLAKSLEKYITKDSNTTLLVDDVLTTGDSMEKAKKEIGGRVSGVVLFTRTENCPIWIYPVFHFALDVG